MKFALLASCLLLGLQAITQRTIIIEKGCYFYKSVLSNKLQVHSFDNPIVEKIIDQILESAGIKKNFDLFESEIGTALVTKTGNSLALVVDSDFLTAVESNSQSHYTSYFILAHEIGHLYHDHIDHPDPRSRFWDELQADDFAGRIIQKLRIPVITFNNVLNFVSSNFDYSHSHPEWQGRMKAAINGYFQIVFDSIKLKTLQEKNITLATIQKEEKELEVYLNNKNYHKGSWAKNIGYRVINRKIIESYDYYKNDTSKVFEKRKDTIDLLNVKRIYLRWHDPGEIAFDWSEKPFEFDYHKLSILTLQSKEVISFLSQPIGDSGLSSYYDDEVTMNDNIQLMAKIISFVARIQGYSEKTGYQ